jgi:SAM-dependent methyltransferase
METTRCISSERMTISNNPFDECSEQYGKFRPDYSSELIAYIRSLSDSNSILVDVGSGTGKASAPLLASGLAVVSVEPSLSMIRQGLRSYPNLVYVCSAAEELPLVPGVADTVICAQAFHWFDAPRALAEFARILKPGGHLCLFWNTRDVGSPAPALFEKLIHKWNTQHDPAYRQKDWAELIKVSGLYDSIDYRRFDFTLPMTIEDWIGLSRTISYVQSMGQDQIPGFEMELRDDLATLDAIDCRYVTELWSARVKSKHSR